MKVKQGLYEKDGRRGSNEKLHRGPRGRRKIVRKKKHKRRKTGDKE